MSKKLKFKRCPFCGGEFTIGLMDNEGNIRPDDYENNPWSGIRYAVYHPPKEGRPCPLDTFDEEICVASYSTREHAFASMNVRFKK